MIKRIYSSICFRLIRYLSIKSIPKKEHVIYLTFDDGPETGITEFVLEELKKYGFKATFFCRGDNAAIYPELVSAIRKEGHTVANHTYSHLCSFSCEKNTYLKDVEHASSILKTSLFRPPHGTLPIPLYWKIKKEYSIILWTINSGDYLQDSFELVKCLNNLKKRTKQGDVVLFHFCQKHERETRSILPLYLRWLFENNYKSETL